MRIHILSFLLPADLVAPNSHLHKEKHSSNQKPVPAAGWHGKVMFLPTPEGLPH